MKAWQSISSSSSSSSSSSHKMAKASSSTPTTVHTTTTTTFIGASTTTGDHHHPSDGLEILPSSRRRQLLLQVPKVVAIVATATSTIMLPHNQVCNAAAAPGMTAESARDQWKQAATVLNDLLQNWSTDKWAEEVGGGDIIRTNLGTQGGTSPLFQIEKAFKVLRDSEYVEDFIEFQETVDEFIEALYRADSMASSSNNKTGSGKQTSPAVFIEQSKDEVIKMQAIAKKLTNQIK